MCRPLSEARWGAVTQILKKKTKGVKPLTDTVIDKLQNYFSLTLRENTGGTVQKMVNAIWASFLHVASNEQQHYHSLCEQSKTSWCQYRRGRFNNTGLVQRSDHSCETHIQRSDQTRRIRKMYPRDDTKTKTSRIIH